MSAASAFIWRPISRRVTSRLARCLALAAAASVVSAASPAGAASERIPFVGALTGERAAIGRDQRDGFLLAVAQQHGSLGGTSVRVTEFDDRGEARRAGTIAGQIVAARIPLVTGLSTAESALALSARLAGKALVLSSAAAPAALAGEKCARNFFSTAPVEDAVHENGGAIAQGRRYRSLYIVTPSAELPMVRKALQRKFAGSLSGAGPASDAIRGIREASPDAVYLALPAKETRAFLVSYEKAGLFQRIPVIAADDGFLPAELHNQFSGLIVSARWSPGLEDERSKRFVAGFEQHYGRKPSTYAMQ